MTTPKSSEGLLFVLGECGPNVTEDEFNDWYDNEHAPLRLTVKGFNNALRYKAIDTVSPKYLAIYDLSTPEVYYSEGYQSLSARASQREKDIVSRVTTLSRRLYTQISVHTLPEMSPSALPGKYVLIVSAEPSSEGETAFNKMYEEQQIPLLLNAPGFIRTRRYKLLDHVELAGNAVTSSAKPLSYIDVYEWSRADFAQIAEVQAMMKTPRYVEASKASLKTEFRSFELYKNIEQM